MVNIINPATALQQVTTLSETVSGILFPNDVVAVYDSNFNQLFKDARPIKAVIKEDAKFMEHPVEDGSTITDFRIITPIEIQLSMFFTAETYLQTYNEVKGYYLNTELLTVQTKTGRYPNMGIQAMPHEEAIDFQDTIQMTLSLKEVILVKAQFEKLPPSSVKNKTDSSTTNGGDKAASDASESESQSVLSKITGFE